jgi:hypothetical protein
VVPQTEIALALVDANVICRADTPSDGTPTPAHHHQMPDCQFCALCMSLATPGIVLSGAVPHPPPPGTIAFHRPGLPPPPVVGLLAAQPRGPPDESPFHAARRGVERV